MIAKLDENLYLSGENIVKEPEKLKRAGITAILNVGYQVTDPNYKEFLMIKIGLREFSPNPDFFKNLAVTTLAQLIENGQTVLIHCHAGAHRSPYIACRYLAEKNKKTLDDVYREIIPKVPWDIIYPHKIE